MYFSKDPVLIKEIFPKIGAPILAQPQVNETNVIARPLVWQRVSGFFVADKPYEFLTIGNFFDDAHTKRINFVEKTIALYGGPASYYCLDDVSVRETNLDRLPTVPNLGPDTTLCSGQAVSFTLQNSPGTTYRWQDGSTALSRTINQSGTYYVTATTDGYPVTDTLHVTVRPTISLPADTVLCQGETLTLAPTYPATESFLWSDGSQDSTLTVSQEGQYWVRVPDTYCPIADTINIQILNCPGEIPNVITPNGDSKNDTWRVPNVELRPWHLEIYNRWGRRVYQTDHYRNEWGGDNLPSGLYYYYLHSPELRRKFKGWVQILR